MLCGPNRRAIVCIHILFPFMDNTVMLGILKIVFSIVKQMSNSLQTTRLDLCASRPSPILADSII